MQKDVCGTPLYREAELLYETIRRPGTGQISDASEVDVSPNGREAVFAAVILDDLSGGSQNHIYHIDLSSSEIRQLTFGPNVDRLPKYSPAGDRIAFLSDRRKTKDFQLYFLDQTTGAIQAAQTGEGWIEYFEWSPNGKSILLGAAGYGADVAGVQGGVSRKSVQRTQSSWMPLVDNGGDGEDNWRRAWVYDVSANIPRPVTSADANVWEATWCGDGSLVAIVSPSPREGSWYRASLRLLNLKTGDSKELYRPTYQLGSPSASPSGKHLAVIDALCSDRLFVAGDLRIIDIESGATHRVDTDGVDIAYVEWRSEVRVLLAGHRGFETVVGIYDAAADKFTQTWSSCEITTGGFYVAVSGINESGDSVLVGESFTRAPEIGVIRFGSYRSLKSFDLGYSQEVQAIDRVDCVSWFAPDGLQIQGWLLRPRRAAPFPLIMNIHGGPVWQWRPSWLGRRSAHLLMLVKAGYAVFFPNPRGSSGFGQEFARHALGGMGGADTYDLLSGIDHLVEEGIADHRRLGVTGVSYGGFMTYWLTTQDSRFGAAVSVAGITNQITEHLISNIPEFMSIFVADEYSNVGGRYLARSPVMHANKATTPTLHICGALDRCTPPEEGVQFHHALLGREVKSTLVMYPEEGHAIRNYPSVIDYAARAVSWFKEHIPANTLSEPTKVDQPSNV